jgi:glucosamine-6-phosphate deaminase
MEIVILESKEELGKAAARKGTELITGALERRGKANIILATGASQFGMLRELTASGIDWPKVTVFHLDEYIGIGADHPASFRRYLKERFADLVSPGGFHYINGEADPREECRRLGTLIGRHPIDVAFVGIGENGHLAFNDPPADFRTGKSYMVVDLDRACRMQQVGEGWFASLGEVPRRAITMTVPRIMKSAAIVCCVPELRKAAAVKASLEKPVSPDVPASILKEHGRAWLFLDRESASLLQEQTGEPD